MRAFAHVLAFSLLVLTANMMINLAYRKDEQRCSQLVTERGSEEMNAHSVNTSRMNRHQPLFKDPRQFSAAERQTRRVHQPESLLLHPFQLASLHLPLFLRDIMADPTVYNIYMVVTKLPDTLSLRYFCSLESFLLENPDATVWFLMLGLDSIEGNSMRLLEGMQREYPNLQLASLDLMLTVKDTPLESIVTTGRLNQSVAGKYGVVFSSMGVYEKELQRLKHLLLESDVLRLALISKVGGLYTDWDYICLRSVTGVRNSIVKELSEIVTNGIFHFDAGHPFLQLAMVEDGINFQPKQWSWNGPWLFTRVLVEYCRGYHFKNPTNGKTDLLNQIKMELHLQTPEPFPPKESVNASSIARVHDPSMAEKVCRSVTVMEPFAFTPVYVAQGGGIEKMFQNGSVDTLLKVPVRSYALHLFNAITGKTVLVEDSALHVVAQRYCPQTHATVHNSTMTL